MLIVVFDPTLLRTELTEWHLSVLGNIHQYRDKILYFPCLSKSPPIDLACCISAPVSIFLAIFRGDSRQHRFGTLSKTELPCDAESSIMPILGTRQHLLVVSHVLILTFNHPWSLSDALFLEPCQRQRHFAYHPYIQRPLMHKTTSTSLYLAKTVKTKKTTKRKTASGVGSSSSGRSTGLNGFGSVGSGVSSGSRRSSKTTSQVELDRSKEARAFYGFLERGGAGDNLNRCALGYFQMDTFKLRGVIALKPIKKGDTIIRIPYELAVNLGQEGADPTIPAVALLRDYCEVLAVDNNVSDKAAYYRMLPPFNGDDCRGSTDFFVDEALDALQSPLIVEETQKRREKVQTRFQLDVATKDDFPTWIDGSTVTAQHLLWAVWLITSRVLTVQGNAEETKSYRLLIPFLDMCNHDRSSSHILTGRAEPGGELKVVAGTDVKEGDAINICYAGGMAGNDRFIQDYGFLDDDVNDNRAYNMIVQQLLGKRRIVEGVGAGRFISDADQRRAMSALNQTAIQEDADMLQTEQDTSMRAAISYRIGVKQALSRCIS
jgi:hypothetical protein